MTLEKESLQQKKPQKRQSPQRNLSVHGTNSHRLKSPRVERTPLYGISRLILSKNLISDILNLVSFYWDSHRFIILRGSEKGIGYSYFFAFLRGLCGWKISPQKGQSSQINRSPQRKISPVKISPSWAHASLWNQQVDFIQKSDIWHFKSGIFSLRFSSVHNPPRIRKRHRILFLLCVPSRTLRLKNITTKRTKFTKESISAAQNLTG